MYIGDGKVIEASGYHKKVIIRPLDKFKKKTTNAIYAGMRSFIMDEVKFT